MNDTLITNVLNSIVNALLEALKPRIDELVTAQIAAMPNPLNGSYVTTEEFRGFERDLEQCRKDINAAVPEELVKRIEQLEENSVDQGELEDKVAREISDYDIESKITDALDDYDFDDKVSDSIRELDVPDEDAVRDMIKSEIGNLRIVQG